MSTKVNKDCMIIIYENGYDITSCCFELSS